MAQLENGNPVTLQELMVSTLAMTDAVTKLLIEKGITPTRSSSRSCWKNVRFTSAS
jgi:hypothetical protein